MAVTKVSSSLIDANLTISGGTVDNTVIGSGTPAAGTFTTISGTLASSVTGTTQSAGDNSTKIATTAYADAAAAAVVDAAPSTLDTLNELAAALGDDANFSTTVTNSIAAKAPIANPTFTGSFTSPGIDDNADATAITIDSSENVGIGTSSPHDSGTSFTVLNVNGTKGGSLAFSRGTNSATKQWAIRTSDDEDLRFEYGSTLASEAMRIDGSNGNVGIGTSSPNTGLSVVTGSANGIELGQDSDASTDSARLFFSTSAGSNAIHSSSGAMRFFTGSTAGSSTGSERMRIDSSGNVGIGATSVFSKLHVEDTDWSSGSPYGTVAYFLGGNVNDNNWGHVLISQDSTATGSGGKLSFGSNGDNPIAGIKAFYAGATFGHLDFYTRPSGGASTQRMRIRSDGNVGIGSSGMPVYSGYAQLSLGPMGHFMAETSSGADRSFHISQNAHFDADGSWETMETDEASNYYQTAGTHVFRVAPSTSAGTDISWSEALRINNDGYLKSNGGNGGLNSATDPYHELISNEAGYQHSYFNHKGGVGTNQYGSDFVLNGDPNNTTNWFIRAGGPSTPRFYVYSNGNVKNTNNSYSAISDEKLKENIEDASSQWADIKALRLRKYSLKEEESATPTQLGLIAQEVEAAGMSGLIYETPDTSQSEGGPIVETGEVTKNLKYSVLYMKAVGALQEAMQRIEALETQVAALQGE